jgi:hypothetical protein
MALFVERPYTASHRGGTIPILLDVPHEMSWRTPAGFRIPLQRRSARRKRIVLLLICSIAVCVVLTSCGGGGARVESSVSTQTLGQQLIDLEKAYKQGVITEKEYNKVKKGLIEKYE